MLSKLVKFFGAIALALAMTPGLALAQSYRGEILVDNDWDDTAHVTLLMERRDEMIRTTWNIRAGQRSYLARDGGRRIRVRADDRIKIRRDSRPVAIGDVGHFRDGVWHVRVRDVYQAQRRRDAYRRDGYRRDGYRP